MSSLFGGDDDGPSMPDLPPAPEPYKFESFRDLIKNREVVQTKGPNGGDQLVHKEIYSDPVAKQLVDMAKQSFSGLLTDITAISKENPRLLAPYQGFINTVSTLNDEDLADWTNSVRPEDFTALKQNLVEMNTFLNNEKWDDYDHKVELNLAARRITSGTVANEARAYNMRSRQITNNQIRLDSEMVGDQLVNSDLARKQGMYQGRSMARGRAMEIAGQQYGLEQAELDRENMGRDDRLGKAQNLLSINKGLVNDDINEKHSADILPTVLGAQDAMTGRQLSAWQQTTSNIMSKYQADVAKHNADQDRQGSFISGLTSLAGGLGMAAMTGGMGPLAMGAMGGMGALGKGGISKHVPNVRGGGVAIPKLARY